MNLDELKEKNVFISYGHDSFAVIARRLVEDLKPYVKNVWFDEKDIHATTSWAEEIATGIENCDFVIALMTKHAYRKPAGVCINEIVYASNKKKQICPVLVENMDVPFILCSIHYFNICDVFNDITGEIYEERYKQKFNVFIEQLLKGSFDFVGYLKDVKTFLNPQNKLNEHAALIQDYVGREWLDEEIDKWISSSSSTMFIIGKPGCGKSAFSTHLCLTQPEIKGIHYCEYNDTSSISLAAIFKTLSFYLLTEFNDYRDLFGDINLNKLDALSVEELFSTLIVSPLRKMKGSDYDKKVVVIIDALDELERKDVTKLLRLFASFKDEMPSWFKILFTSRPNPAYLKELSMFSPIEIELESTSNINDIKDFIRSSEYAKDLSEEDINLIVTKSGGVFQYAKNILEELKNNPDYDLESLPLGLIGKYEDDFNKYFDDDSFKEFSPILEIIAASKEPMHRNMIEEIIDDDYLLGECLGKLQSYLNIQDGKVSFFHKSIYDWLTDKESGSYYISKKAGNKRICQYIMDNVSPDLWRKNHYVVNYGFAHLYERKEYSAIAEILSLNKGGIVDLFCNYISKIIIEEDDFDECLDTIIEECDCHEYVFAKLIKNLLEKGLYEECKDKIVSYIKNDVTWADEYLKLCHNRPLSRFNEIIKLYNEILDEVKDPQVLNEIYEYVGDAHRLLGDLDNAYEYYLKVIESVRDRERTQKCFLSLYNYLDVKYVQGYINVAKEEMTKLLPELEKEGDGYKLCKANRLLANIAYQSGDIDLARKHYSNAYELAKSANRPLTQAESLESMAKTYVGIDNELARKLNNEAKEITKKYSFNEILAKTYYPESTIYLSEENYTKALEVALEGEKLNVEINYLTGTARMRRYVARAYLGLGKYDLAIDYAKKSIDGYRKGKTYPISRLKSYIVLLKAAKAINQLDKYSSYDNVDDIYYQEMPNAQKYLDEIKNILA